MSSEEPNTVYIALQNTEEAFPIVQAIRRDNPEVEVEKYPAMYRLTADGRLEIHQSTVEELIGRPWDVQELHVSLISIGGNVHEDDDRFVLYWGKF